MKEEKNEKKLSQSIALLVGKKYNVNTNMGEVTEMAESKKQYEAPKVVFLKFDENDVLRTSGWSFNCSQQGGGDDAAPPNCDISVHTDNSKN